ncbi:MAG: hypothetical protein IJ996_03560 [Clostridia bacterium]|nr:hypothetical protein [Clostridia bacterium]
MEDKTQEKLQLQDEISLVDILRLFVRKLKILIIVALVAIIAGASYGYIKTRDVNYFGTTIAFYVNPQKDENSDQESEYSIYGSYGENVMDNMVKLLSSELFAESLMLDKDGLPDDGMIDKVKATKGEEVATALATKVANARATLAAIDTKDAELDAATDALSEAKDTMYALQSDVNNAWADLGKYGTPGRIASPSNEDEHTYNTIWDNYQLAIDAYETATEQQAIARDNLKAAKKAQKAAFEDTLAQWRKDYSAYYAGELARYRWAASYSYKSASDGSDSNFARSFFYVYISVTNDVDFANNVRNRIVEYVPMFIEEIMPVPGGYLDTNCQRITRNDYIVNTNAGYARNTAIRYAILLAAVAIVVACVIIVIVDRSDKRLRAVEQITEKFNLPVLGVIPNIHIVKDKNTEDNE